MVELEKCLGPEMDRGEVDIVAVLSRSGDLDHALEVALGAKQIGQRQADDVIETWIEASIRGAGRYLAANASGRATGAWTTASR